MQVERIWAQSEITDFIIGSVHGINITDRDIKSLQGNQWLTDQVSIFTYLEDISIHITRTAYCYVLFM